MKWLRVLTGSATGASLRVTSLHRWGVCPESLTAGYSGSVLCTFYLPPVGGYFSLRWLGRKGYL